MKDPPLAGIRVLDFTKVLAGPLCTQYMADMGADVIKVETPRGDETRHWPPFVQDTGTVFLSANRGKRSMVLDLKSPQGQQVLHSLVETADVVIESHVPAVARKLGLDAAALRAVNPRLVHCSISGYGQAGPLAEAAGYDLILQAFSGMLSITGEEGGGPVRSPMSPVDQMTGMHALSAIQAALIRRGRTGAGAAIEVSLFETSVALMAYVLQSYWSTGRLPGKSGCGHPSLCPYEVFEASDGPMMLGVPSDNLWRRFCDVIDRPDLLTDDRYATNAARVRNYDETIALVRDIVATRASNEWLDMLTAAGIPCAPMNDLERLVNHPHTRSRGLIETYAHPVLGPIPTVLQPVIFDGAQRQVRAAAPMLGQHTQEILSELDHPGPPPSDGTS
jgi:crotonobetainyl-CoA:carnitine CoA-transferase CaiB-like acyl-CoA transferase